jgi:hypothetical protein
MADKNYFDGNGNLVNVENKSLAEIYQDGAKSVNRWIPVEDALPEIYEKVLTADIDGYVTENYRCNVRTGQEWAKGFRITHWMPLPEPPEKE